MTDSAGVSRGDGRTRPRRMVYGSWFGELGGGELRLLDHLRSTAFRPDSTAVLVNQPGPLINELEALGIKSKLIRWHAGASYAARQFHWYAAHARTALVLRSLDPDVVVCNTFFDFETTGRVAAQQGRRLIWRARADTFPTAHLWSPGRLQRLVDLLNTRVDRILATTSYEAGMMLDAGVRAAKVFVVRNGVDVARYSAAGNEAELRGSLGITSEHFCIAFVARMVPQKGYETFFEAIALAKGRGLPVRVLIAGDTTLLEGPRDQYKQALRDQIGTLGLDREIHFLGFRDDVESVMRACDVFVLASLKEPFGTTVIEAMAAGRAVVASDLPGPRESILEDSTGLFFPAGDAAALAERLVTLYRDPSMRLALGSAGRTRVEAEFDLQRNIATLDQHCIEVASDGGLARRAG